MQQIINVLERRYSRIQPAGSGGVARLYRVWDPLRRETIAVKTLREEFENDPAAQEQLETEAELQQAVNSPFVVKILDFIRDDSYCWITEEYVRGQTLRDYLFAHPSVEMANALELCVLCCTALASVHEKGVIHGDVKPLNFILSGQAIGSPGSIKLTDFSEARMANAKPAAGPIRGWISPLYMSPEAAAGELTSPASDVYSLGVLFYRILTGHLPFRSENADEMVRLHTAAPLPDPQEIQPEIDRHLSWVLRSMLNKDPAERFPNASAVLAAL